MVFRFVNTMFFSIIFHVPYRSTRCDAVLSLWKTSGPQSSSMSLVKGSQPTTRPEERTDAVSCDLTPQKHPLQKLTWIYPT